MGVIVLAILLCAVLRSRSKKFRNVYSAIVGSETARNQSLEGTHRSADRSASAAVEAGVNRNTSVRSVITLPAYSSVPKESEQVIGREGERGGMDTVVEFPETQEQEETRREEQMDSLYQIRLARRREIAEREERRRERREARDRGDWARLEELRRESRARATSSLADLNANQDTSVATLIAEHQSRGRDRRVSSVSYASVGYVRHDGSRLRANSNDSERGGLLDEAASMGESEGRPNVAADNGSLTSLSTYPRDHRRQYSTSSLASLSTAGSDQENADGYTPMSTQADEDTRNNSEEATRTSNSSPTTTRFTPDESTGSEGANRSPDTTTQPRPPDYENLDWGDAPAYETSNTTTSVPTTTSTTENEPQIPQIRRQPSSPPQLPQLDLPSIRVEVATEPNTPASPSPHVTTSGH